jgi:hypothetical protein
MSSQDYSITVTVDQTPQEVFDAINDVRAWWTGDVEGSTDELGAEFTYRHQELHYSKQRITQLSPGKRVVWHVVEADLAFTRDKAEWKGTDIVFDIAEQDGKTELRFTHVGLVPAIECYSNCSDAWRYFVAGSLRSLITTAKN